MSSRSSLLREMRSISNRLRPARRRTGFCRTYGRARLLASVSKFLTLHGPARRKLYALARVIPDEIVQAIAAAGFEPTDIAAQSKRIFTRGTCTLIIN